MGCCKSIPATQNGKLPEDYVPDEMFSTNPTSTMTNPVFAHNDTDKNGNDKDKKGKGFKDFIKARSAPKKKGGGRDTASGTQSAPSMSSRSKRRMNSGKWKYDPKASFDGGSPNADPELERHGSFNGRRSSSLREGRKSSAKGRKSQSAPSLKRADSVMGVPMEALPRLDNCYNMEKLKKVWRRKLFLCEIEYSFLPDEDTANENLDDSFAEELDIHGGTPEEQLGRRLKSNALQELAEFLDPRRTKDLRDFLEDADVTLAIQSFVVAHIERDLPFVATTFDPAKDDLCLEPSWAHLQYVYEICLRTVRNIVSPDGQRSFLSNVVVQHLVNKVQSNDPRERACSLEVLRTALVKADKELEDCILKVIVEALQLYAYEGSAYCLGVTGLMELCSIVVQKQKSETILPQPPLEVARGLTAPFIRVMLHCCHAPDNEFQTFHRIMVDTLSAYAERNAHCAPVLIQWLGAAWPWRSTVKQILFLDLFEALAEWLEVEKDDDNASRPAGQQPHHLVPLQFWRIIKGSFRSDHVKVAARTLCLFRNEYLSCHGVLQPSVCHQEVLPLLYSDNLTKTNTTGGIVPLAFWDEWTEHWKYVENVFMGWDQDVANIHRDRLLDAATTGGGEDISS